MERFDCTIVGPDKFVLLEHRTEEKKKPNGDSRDKSDDESELNEKTENPIIPEKSINSEEMEYKIIEKPVDKREEIETSDLVRKEVKRQMAAKTQTWKHIIISVGAGMLIGFGAGRTAR